MPLMLMMRGLPRKLLPQAAATCLRRDSALKVIIMDHAAVHMGPRDAAGSKAYIGAVGNMPQAGCAGNQRTSAEG